MTRYSFTGPSSLDDSGYALAADVVNALDDPFEITTGGADGWDTAVCHAALRAWPDVHHRIILPGAPFNRAGLVHAAELARDLHVERFTVVNLPPEADAATSYRVRNVRLVDEADVLVAAVRQPTFYRSGEFMTINIARKRRIAVQLVQLPRPSLSLR